MGGKCETCLKKDGCTKIIGAMFGFCNTDYEEEFIEKTGMREKEEE